MKKYFIFILFLAFGCVWDQPADQEEVMAGSEGKTGIFSVTLGTGSVDCGLPTLLFTAEDSVRIANLTGEGGRTCMAYPLEPEFNQPGRIVIVTVRHPREDETVVCTAMGPIYPMVFVIQAEWVK